MQYSGDLFKYKRFVPSKLLSYGFVYDNGAYTYKTFLLNGGFQITVTVHNDLVYTEVIDCETNDEYVLIYIKEASGSFIGALRSEYDSLLTDIASKCTEAEVFKSSQAKEIISYITEKYGDSPEYLWAKYPNNTVFRESSTNKWYAAILTASKTHFMPGDGDIEVIDIKGDPNEIASLIDNATYFPAYHMNKKHWFTILLNNSVPTAEIFKFIDKSYHIIKSH